MTLSNKELAYLQECSWVLLWKVVAENCQIINSPFTNFLTCSAISFFALFSVVQPTQIFGIYKKGVIT